jgi:hypothetical protein
VDRILVGGERADVIPEEGEGVLIDVRAVTNVLRNAAGASMGMTWAFPNGQAAVTDTVVRSQSGRIVANTITDGSVSATTAYTYDTHQRLGAWGFAPLEVVGRLAVPERRRA